ncbi:T9SS type A sorting domain-containing protein [Flavobacterium sp. LC2016-12]|uniref:T9SS type A sorting domain-containing protein n=1 Tax=Flavobacterium sp. LC2016-12 TaxID=2783794 RepID=UPI001E3CD671|nr:T9SS type A sorting domain-containing protein [Flavobacterium sp. LC2016-12]
MTRILFLLVLSTSKCFAQIYFGPTANMYVKSEILFVQQNINLEANSNLYLRNNGQLIQGTTLASTNTGQGKLSVYQEGTSDNFEYNYWCSPVGNASATVGNENFGITMLNQPTTSTLSNPATVISNYNGTANPLAISSVWIHKLINANNYSQWVFVGGASTIAAGEGFSMKGTSGTDSADPEGTGVVNNSGSAQRYDFRGKPNDGNITINLGANNSTLTGNPYPSALHLNAFLLDSDNLATGGIAYFWEQDKTVNSHFLAAYRGGYGSYSPMSVGVDGVYVPATFNSYNQDGTLNTTGLSSSLSIPRRYAPIGQGFVVFANANGTATFKNAHRIYTKEGPGVSQFEKQTKQAADKTNSNEEVNVFQYFKLNTIIDNKFTRQLALAFLPEATDGVDIGIDALNMDTSPPNDVAFWIENSSYVIQGLNFDQTKKIPITVKAGTSATFKFYIPEVINFDTSQSIYLYDALDQSYHDIKNEGYQVTVAPGIYSDRFKITFTSETLGVSEEAHKQFIIFQDNNNNVLKASNPNNIAIKSVKIYDMLGKVVLSKKDLGSEANFSFSTNGLSHGIYIVEFLTTENKKLTEKVVISNSAR